MRYLDFVKDFKSKEPYFEKRRLRCRLRYNELMELKEKMLLYYELQEYIIAFPDSPIKNYEDFKIEIIDEIVIGEEKLEDYYGFFI